MKKKGLIILVMIFLLCLIQPNYVYAQTDIQDGIEITVETEKEEYQQGEEIIIETTVRNLKGTEITNVSIEHILPKGYIFSVTEEQTIEKLQMGEGYTVLFNVEKGNSFDSYWIFIGVGSGVLIAVFLVFFVFKKKKQTIAMGILLALLISTFGPYGEVIIEAAEKNTIETSSNINIESQAVDIKTIVTYEEVVNRDNAKKYTRGEWVALLLDKLEKELIDVDENQIRNFSDTIESEYGMAVENAYQMAILPNVEAKEFGINEIATREFAAYTVYYAMAFQNELELSCEDSETVTYAKEVALILQQGFLSKIDDKFMPLEPITEVDVQQIFTKIDYFNSSWNSEEFEEVGTISYREDVVVGEDISYEVIDNGDETYKVVISDKQFFNDIKEGTKFVLIDNTLKQESWMFRAKEIVSEGDNWYIICEIPKFDEVVGEYEFAKRDALDFSNFVPADDIQVEYDPNGTLNSEDVPDYNIAQTDLGVGKVSFTFKEKEIGNDTGIKLSGNVSMNIPQLTFVLKGDGFDIEELTLLIAKQSKLSGKVEWSSEVADKAAISGSKLTLGEVLCTPIPAIPAFTIRVKVFLEIGLEGEISVSYGISDLVGIQYKDESCRNINDVYSKEVSVEAEAKMKIGPVLGIYLMIFKYTPVGGEISVALAGKFNAATHLDTSPNLICIDASAYIEGALGLGNETGLGKILDEKDIKITWDFWKSTNSPWKKNWHVENGNTVTECTYGVGNIVGRVVDKDGQPIVDATVKVNQITNGNFKADTKTKSKQELELSTGDFLLENLPIGKYNVEISADGYKGICVEIEVEKDKRVDCGAITLEKVDVTASTAQDNSTANIQTENNTTQENNTTLENNTPSDDDTTPDNTPPVSNVTDEQVAEVKARNEAYRKVLTEGYALDYGIPIIFNVIDLNRDGELELIFEVEKDSGEPKGICTWDGIDVVVQNFCQGVNGGKIEYCTSTGYLIDFYNDDFGDCGENYYNVNVLKMSGTSKWNNDVLVYRHYTDTNTYGIYNEEESVYDYIYDPISEAELQEKLDEMFPTSELLTAPYAVNEENLNKYLPIDDETIRAQLEG